jgi:hypothetical protein
MFAQAAQKAGIDAAAMPEVAKQLPEALMTQGLVRIPTAEYAATIAGTRLDAELLPHLKTDPEGMSYADSQAFYQQQAGRMQEAATQLVQGKAEQDALRESQARVADTIAQQLDALGRFTPGREPRVRHRAVGNACAHRHARGHHARGKYAPRCGGCVGQVPTLSSRRRKKQGAAEGKSVVYHDIVRSGKGNGSQ